MKTKFFIASAVALVTIACQKEQPTQFEVASPEGVNKISFSLESGAPSYSVTHGEKTVLNPSKLGFVFKNAFLDPEIRAEELI